MMKKLLTVEDRFLIPKRGLVLLPGLRVPELGFRGFRGEVEVYMLSGICIKCEASFNLEHHLYSASEGRGEWKIVVTLNNVSKDQIEIGCELFAEEKIFMALTQGEPK